MSRPYAQPEGPPAGLPHHLQHDWLYPDTDQFGEPYEDLYSVIDGAGAKRMLGGPRAPVDTRTPSAPPSPPEPQGPAASSASSNS